MSSTFEKYGGFSAVSRIVMSFYELVLENDDVGHHFDHVDMPRLMDHQTKFISSLMGGPAAMGDDRLEVVHRQYQITEKEFAIVQSLLSDALREHGVDPHDVAEIEHAFRSKKNLIVSAERV